MNPSSPRRQMENFPNWKQIVKILPSFFILTICLLFTTVESLHAQIKIAVSEVSAQNDIDIREGTITDLGGPYPEVVDRDITDPIWLRTFALNGKPLPPTIDDPIADHDDFVYQYVLYPLSEDILHSETTVQYKWEIMGSGIKSDWRWDGLHPLRWVGNFPINLPDKVGKYSLNVEIKIYVGNKKYRHEKLKHTLYVLYSTPVENASENYGTDYPRISWLEFATKGAKGKITETDILEALTYHVHTNPLKWGYSVGDLLIDDPRTLIDGISDGGECSTFREVLRILAASLGIYMEVPSPYPIDKYSAPSYSLPGNPDGVSYFLTSIQPALDKNFSANGFNNAIGHYDRWKFHNHFVATNLGKNHFYDPTFGLHGPFDEDEADSSLEGNVFCKVYGLANDDNSPHKCYFQGVEKGSNYGYVLTKKEDDPTTIPWTESTFSLPNAFKTKLYVLNYLTTFIPSGDYKTDIALTKAFDHISNCLSPELWADSVHLTSLGKKVFEEEKKAAKELQKIKYAPTAGKLMKLFDLMILVDATLAKRAIEDAIDEGIELKKIEKAEKEMEKAGKEIKKWKFEKGILHLKKAWEHMQKELNQGRSAAENNTLLWAEQDPEAILLYCYSSDSEKTNEKFVIERSNDGFNFTEIFEVDAQFAAYQSKSYTHLDDNPQVGKNFYRLKVEYSDGSVNITKPIQVTFKPLANFSLYPNPAEIYSLIDLKEFIGLEAKISISHNSVILFKDHLSEINHQTYYLDLKDFSDGFYQVYIKVEGKRAVTKKLIIIKPH